MMLVIVSTPSLGVLAEASGLGIPVVMLPFVNSALAGRRAFRRSVDELRAEGVRAGGVRASSSRHGW
ncbi:hypothetical protein [Actinoallomurus sp. NPDC050550]|uniref:hypothetical protein n=1 Tax=Actinoallomurus sp. NPDC050550 TaxID=3154937 RepID=UPI0033C7C4B0